ncbi:MAG TPA: polysaccharide biosynthesis/export family protein [Verrucomicrobiota bacterium]|nr:polysaccharide biosynthesis/export family protein [Verrucomicrobiota bacterium]
MNKKLISHGVVMGLALLVAVTTVRGTDSASSGKATALSGANGKRAKWQERLTLGPGDVVSISMLESPDSFRGEVLVGPDGRINYMEVQDFVVTGMTIDELRAALDKKLADYYRSPRTIVVPVAFQSKKYYMLGAVGRKGVFTLDRPTTIIEAVARSGGLASGVINRNPTELADLTHSFLIRNGQRVPVDFEKLFQRGDLTQNIPLEPDDYLCFPPATMNEVFVFGEVGGPGPQLWDPATTMISAITRAGSFSPIAYRQKVLVVRGSLNNPQTFVVNTAAILKGEQPDFKLEPRDIVYVNAKPWQYAQDLLGNAIAVFVQSAVITYAGDKISPIIKDPIIK